MGRLSLAHPLLTGTMWYYVVSTMYQVSTVYLPYINRVCTVVGGVKTANFAMVLYEKCRKIRKNVSIICTIRKNVLSLQRN